MKLAQIGKTSLHVTELGLGTSRLGNLFSEVSDTQAAEVMDTAWSGGLRYFDTAPFYGLGLSETRVGRALAGHNQEDFVLSTKVGRLLLAAKPAAERHGFVNPLPNDIIYDYSYDGIMKSYQDSLARMGVERIDILLVHDIGEMTHGTDNKRHLADLENGGYRALDELRRSGDVKAIGLGVNEVKICEDVMNFGQWDCFLLAGRYTLLEQGGLHDFLPACLSAGTSIILGGAYNSGILATGTRGKAVPMYDYAPAPDDIIAKVRKIEDICEAHQINMTAAALQFPLAHQAVACVIPGMGNPRRIAQTMALYDTPIPADLWRALKDDGLMDEAAPVPSSPGQDASRLTNNNGNK